MRIPKRTLLVALSGLAVLSMLVAAFAVFHVGGARAATGITGTIRTVTSAGVGSPASGDFTPSGSHDVTQAEFGGETDDEAAGPGPYSGTIVDQSHSQG